MPYMLSYFFDGGESIQSFSTWYKKVYRGSDSHAHTIFTIPTIFSKKSHSHIHLFYKLIPIPRTNLM